jgi:signal transduction histidine kinase
MGLAATGQPDSITFAPDAAAVVVAVPASSGTTVSQGPHDLESVWSVEHLPLFWRLLNFGLVATLLLLYLCFTRPGGIARSRAEFWLLTAGLAAQTCVVIWFLAQRWDIDRRTARLSLPISTGINFLLALGLSLASPVGDIQCAVLMSPPVIFVAFREPLWRAVLLALFAGMMTLLSPGFRFSVYHDVQMSAVFNATALSVGQVLVAVVVWLFAGAFRIEEQRRRLTEARLAANERLAAVGRLAAGIAHEIRNPVAMIASSLELASVETTPTEVRAEMSQVAREESARLTQLTNDFLAYARGKPPQRRPFLIAVMLEYLAGLSRARAAEAHVEIVTECPAGLEANADEQQLHQAMLNLVTNAIDATASGGSVTIGARATPDNATDFYVANTGDPISPPALDRLFEPFHSTKPQGTGLGLPIARSIAVAHGGDLNLTDNRAGYVCFILSLPPSVQSSADAEGGA